jgi:hypothetical protein
MYHFWEKVVKPIFIATRPKQIVEIGAAVGENTARILGYCHPMGAQLTVIDPAPQFDIPAWLQTHPNTLTLLQQLSLQALPTIEEYDVILIDGDHNWYTVYHELLTIEQRAKIRGKLPIILLHDTMWPYARRDMYYLPDTIPADFRHPHACMGMLPGVTGLVPHGGSNYTLYNALNEGGPRNGVLTAIEDFFKQLSLPHFFHNVPAQHGLGIILPYDPSLNQLVTYILQTSGMI